MKKGKNRNRLYNYMDLDIRATDTTTLRYRTLINRMQSSNSAVHDFKHGQMI